jgi:hypothetical protein
VGAGRRWVLAPDKREQGSCFAQLSEVISRWTQTVRSPESGFRTVSALNLAHFLAHPPLEKFDRGGGAKT